MNATIKATKDETIIRLESGAAIHIEYGGHSGKTPHLRLWVPGGKVVDGSCDPIYLFQQALAYPPEQ